MKNFKPGSRRNERPYRLAILVCLAGTLWLLGGCSSISQNSTPSDASSPTRAALMLPQETLSSGRVVATSTPAPTSTLAPRPQSSVVTMNRLPFENRVQTATPTIPSPAPRSSPAPSVSTGRGSARYTPTPNASNRRIVIVGDSIMLSAQTELKGLLGDFFMDARVGRPFLEGIEVVRKLRDAGELGDLVIIHLGTNGPMTTEQFDEMMQLLKDVNQVVFVNLKVPRDWETANNKIIQDGVKRYPNTSLIDWHTASVNRSDFFGNDGFHLNPDGIFAYARLIATSLNFYRYANGR